MKRLASMDATTLNVMACRERGGNKLVRIDFDHVMERVHPLEQSAEFITLYYMTHAPGVTYSIQIILYYICLIVFLSIPVPVSKVHHARC